MQFQQHAVHHQAYLLDTQFHKPLTLYLYGYPHTLLPPPIHQHLFYPYISIFSFLMSSLLYWPTPHSHRKLFHILAVSMDLSPSHVTLVSPLFLSQTVYYILLFHYSC